MMTLDSFDQTTLAALDDFVRLLHVHKSVRGMNPTFRNAGARGLSAIDAKPAATTILKATRLAADALSNAAFAGDLQELERVHRRHRPRLLHALGCACELARQERDAIPEVGDRGVFRQHVELPLRAITAAWAAQRA